MSILGKNKINISEERLIYRLKNLSFSQNMLNTWTRNKEEFFEKYIRGIYWSDSTEKDRMYEENMSYGRDFHILCQRMFMGIDLVRGDSSGRELDDYTKLEKIAKIKSAYDRYYGDRLVYRPELEIEYKGSLFITLDLLVEIYKDGRLDKIDIWDWKTEKKRIDEMDALKKMQTRVYMYVVKETIARDLDYGNVSMHYYQPSYDNNIKIVYSNKLHQENKNMIWDLVREIRSPDSYKDFIDAK